MSDPGSGLPPEVFDSIIDDLHDEPEALKTCSLVSKSWVPRARGHLFYKIKFRSSDEIDAWKRAFPDPTTSPAYHTRSLSVRCADSVTSADAEEGGWLQQFGNVVRLELWGNGAVWQEPKPKISFIPFYGFSQVVKSLRIMCPLLPLAAVFDLICSLSLLENLTIISSSMDTRDMDVAVPRPSKSPPLTGTLCIHRSLVYVARRLLDLPDGLHFRELTCSGCLTTDLEWVTALVERCSDTLKLVNIDCPLHVENASSASVNLSEATKLEEVAFRFDGNYLKWVTSTLNTITSNHINFQRVVICVPLSFFDNGISLELKVGENIQEEAYLLWTDLDRVLVGLWESRRVRTEAVVREGKEELLREGLRVLLPEMTRRGAIELRTGSD